MFPALLLAAAMLLAALDAFVVFVLLLAGLVDMVLLLLSLVSTGRDALNWRFLYTKRKNAKIKIN